MLLLKIVNVMPQSKASGNFTLTKIRKDNGIAVLEALKPKMDTSPVLLELLGDAYKEDRRVLKKQMRYTPSG